jgi:hypothetical protein
MYQDGRLPILAFPALPCRLRLSTDLAHISLISPNPVSVMQFDLGHESMPRSPLSSMASPQSIARGGHQSASQLATATGASPTPTASGNSNRQP